MTMFDQFTEAGPELIRLDFCGEYHYVEPAVISIYADNSEVLEIQLQSEQAQYPALIGPQVREHIAAHLVRILADLDLDHSHLSASWSYDRRSHEATHALKTALGIQHSW